MSSVVISGDTSGSVTLQAPAVAGTTVLTLPATSGTVITGPGGVVAITEGGTGQTTATAAFNALNPMTTTGDILYESSPTVAARLPIGSTGQVLTVAGGLPSWAAAAGGQLQTELFTAPGTWTKPSSVSQVRVTVIGGGGGGGNPGFGLTGGTGGTSSFGPAVSATGGSGGTGSPATNGSAGAGTVSTGTALKRSNTGIAISSTQLQGTQHFITSGRHNTGGTTPFSTSDNWQAGGYGAISNFNGGGGGIAIANVPVSNPVAITVGAGGPAAGSVGGVGGAVIVEYVG